MAPKRKFPSHADGPNKATKATSADKLGLTFSQFSATAPDLTCDISNSAIEASSLLKVDLKKQKMSTGSFGWSGNGQRINVEIRLADGSLRIVPAQVSINLTLVGSKKADKSIKAIGNTASEETPAESEHA